MQNGGKSNLNAIIVQYQPIYKNVEANIIKLEKMLSQYTTNDKIDIVIFPEMALTGYIFQNIEDISDFLEEFNSGKTYDFCSFLAKRLNSYVFCGYPEKYFNSITNKYEYYNSCMIVNRNGKASPSYRKHFLYEMDKTWCIEGEDFGYMEIETLNGNKVKLGIGICMDLNPYEFTAPWDAMEMANFCLKKDVDVILFLTNWIDNEPFKNTKKEIMQMINYWVMRLEPFFEKPPIKPVYFLAADRCGKEQATSFIGCSCAIMIYQCVPRLIKFTDKCKEETLMASLNFLEK
jgi:protein N-terminal amidase